MNYCQIKTGKSFIRLTRKLHIYKGVKSSDLPELSERSQKQYEPIGYD